MGARASNCSHSQKEAEGFLQVQIRCKVRVLYYLNYLKDKEGRPEAERQQGRHEAGIETWCLVAKRKEKTNCLRVLDLVPTLVRFGV